METEQSAGKLTTLQPEMQRSRSSSIASRTKQLVALAEVMREPLTPECIAIYLESLADLTDEQFMAAVRRAIDEVEWFPKPSKLRALAGVNREEQEQIQAENAWEYANRYLRHYGVDRLPVYSRGRRIEPPALPPRIEYALRSIGGLWGLNQVTSESLPFRKSDFATAYNQAPVAERLAPQLAELFGEHKLLGQLKHLTTEAAPPVQKSAPQAVPNNFDKPYSHHQPLTDMQIRERRQLLREQLELVRDRFSQRADSDA